MPTFEERFARLAADAETRTGPIRMINLIRFRETAEYEPGQEPEDGPISGARAYTIYGQHTGPFLEAVGGSQAWVSTDSMVVIGPSDEEWDAAFAVRYPSRRAFLDMVQNPGYQAIVHHRTAAVADSRLILTEVDET